MVAGAKRAITRYAHTGCFGHLFLPAAGNTWRYPGLPWACDNGAFREFDEPAFVKMLVRHSGQEGCLWVTAPDVVGDARRTLAQFDRWDWFIRDAGYPVALVGQDGLTSDTTPWERMDALFIGGTTEWKLGPEARALMVEAKARGLHVHVGRVNTVGRVRYLQSLGVVDTIDGSKLTKWPDHWFPQFNKLLSETQSREAA